jgi:hypothetical protein
MSQDVPTRTIRIIMDENGKKIKDTSITVQYQLPPSEIQKIIGVLGGNPTPMRWEQEVIRDMPPGSPGFYSTQGGDRMVRKEIQIIGGDTTINIVQGPASEDVLVFRGPGHAGMAPGFGHYPGGVPHCPKDCEHREHRCAGDCTKVTVEIDTLTLPAAPPPAGKKEQHPKVKAVK